MPHNFFRKRACIEARDHGEPSRAVKSAQRRNGINVQVIRSLLEELVRTHSDRLGLYQPESTTERKLDPYCRHRRSLLDLATKTELKLISTLKQYFPLAVNLFAAVGMKSDIALDFPSRWPTLDELQRAKTHTVRSFFYAHNSRSQSLIEKRLQQIADAHNVTDDFALIEPLVLTTKCLVGQLRQFNRVGFCEAIQAFAKSAESLEAYPDTLLTSSALSESVASLISQAILAVNKSIRI
jgi:hypothetical protein